MREREREDRPCSQEAEAADDKWRFSGEQVRTWTSSWLQIPLIRQEVICFGSSLHVRPVFSASGDSTGFPAFV